MTKRSDLGQLGEDLASEYLKNKGFRIVERNSRRPWGELDIVAMAPDKTLVFVEVKTMTSGNEDRLKPEDQMTPAKIRKFKKAASLYAGSHQELIKDKKGWRLDLVAVMLTDDGEELTDVSKNCVIKHYENIS